MTTTDRPEQRLHIPRARACPACEEASKHDNTAQAEARKKDPIGFHNEASAWTGERTYNGKPAAVPDHRITGRVG